MTSRPEQTFFADPAMDRAMGLIMTLAAELYVARDHVRVLETILVEKGVIRPDEVEQFVPSPEQREQWEADRDHFVGALMQQIRGEQVSKGVRR